MQEQWFIMKGDTEEEQEVENNMIITLDNMTTDGRIM